MNHLLVVRYRARRVPTHATSARTSAGERADHLLPPRARGASSSAASGAARSAGPGAAPPTASSGPVTRSGRPRAPPARLGWSRRVRICSATGTPSTSRETRVSSASAHGRMVNTGRAGAQERLAPRRQPDRPGAPALEQVLHLLGDLLAHQHVQAVVCLDPRRAAWQQRLLPANDHAEQRVARQPQLAHAAAGDRVVLAHRELDHLGASRRIGSGLGQRPRQRGLARRHAELPRQPLERRALQQRREHAPRRRRC